MAASPESNMADFDAIYEEDDEDLRANEDSLVSLVPEPVVIRGAGNMTVFGLSNKFDTEFPPTLSAKIHSKRIAESRVTVNSSLFDDSPKFVGGKFACVCCYLKSTFSQAPRALRLDVCVAEKAKTGLNLLCRRGIRLRKSWTGKIVTFTTSSVYIGSLESSGAIPTA
ncbi:unnamed protein product [Ixodes persulcatus]